MCGTPIFFVAVLDYLYFFLSQLLYRVILFDVLEEATLQVTYV